MFARSDCKRKQTNRLTGVVHAPDAYAGAWFRVRRLGLGAGKIRYSPVKAPWQRFLYVIWLRKHEERVVRKGWFPRRRPP